MEIDKPKISLKDQPTVVCDSCGHKYFREVIYIKKVSKILTGSPEDTTVPFPIYKCDSCGHINSGFNPFEEEDKKHIINE